MKRRSIAALAIFLGSAVFISQPIEVRAAESHYYADGLPSERSDRWMSSASIGGAALKSKQYDTAIKFLTAALGGAVRKVDAAYLHRLRGDAYLGKGDSDKALAEYVQAINFIPKDSDQYFLRGSTYGKMSRYKAAASDYAKAIAVSPDDATALNALAWLRATCPDASVRDGRGAVRAGTKACELRRWKDSASMDTLAAAYAEIGSFDQAVKLQQQVLQMRSIEPDRRRSMQERLVSYQQRRPYRQPPKLKVRR